MRLRQDNPRFPLRFETRNRNLLRPVRARPERARRHPRKQEHEMKLITDLDTERSGRSADPNAPLDALVRRLAQLVDYIFDRKGEVDTVWLIESPRGQVMTVTPLTTSEQELADFMRVFFQKHKVTRYVHAGAYH